MVRTHLIIASYNVHGCSGAGGRDLARVARVIAETGADVVGLQEVGDLSGRDAPCQAQALADATGMALVYAPNVVRGRARFGNAILSRWPVLSSQAYDLSIPRREPRGCVRALLDLGRGAQVHVFNVHLGLSFRERSQQTARLLSDDILRDAALGFPAVVVGDFNLWLPGYVPRPLRRQLRDLAPTLKRASPTYPSRWPLFRLDRIYLGPGVLPRWSRVHRSPLAIQASDHLPLIAGVELARSGQVATAARASGA